LEKHCLGNDIVDLTEPGVSRQHLNKRFMSRVFTEIERNQIHSSSVPSLALWSVWAAKESVYKIVKRRRPGAVFAHQAYEVDLATQTLKHEDVTYYLRFSSTPEYVHCVASANQDFKYDFLIARSDEDIEGSLDPLEMFSVYDENSRKVRLLAKKMLRNEFALESPQIVRNDSSPPEVREQGNVLKDFRLSLSHDGDWLAVAAIENRTKR
jgi:phosphopantetheinyl transferase (holo-ACP synthase)